MKYYLVVSCILLHVTLFGGANVITNNDNNNNNNYTNTTQLSTSSLNSSEEISTDTTTPLNIKGVSENLTTENRSYNVEEPTQQLGTVTLTELHPTQPIVLPSTPPENSPNSNDKADIIHVGVVATLNNNDSSNVEHSDKLFINLNMNPGSKNEIKVIDTIQNETETWIMKIQQFGEQASQTMSKTNVFVVFFTQLFVSIVTVLALILGLFKCYRPRKWLLQTFLGDFRRMINADQTKI